MSEHLYEHLDLAAADSFLRTDRQKLIDAYAKKYPGLKFTWSTRSIPGCGEPPFEFRLKVLIEEQDRHNTLCTHLKDDGLPEWDALRRMIDTGAAWAKEMRRKFGKEARYDQE